MATLSTTLSSAKPASSPSGRSTGGYSIPRVSNPYTKLGANVSGLSGGSSQNFYAGLLQNQGFQRPLPSTEFQSQYNFDPVLSRLNALSEMTIQNARSEAAALKKQALIDAGDDAFASGVGADQSTIDAAKANQLSTSANLQKEFGDRSHQLDEALNQQGLFYSGERVRQMSELERGKAQAQTDFLQKLRDLFSGIDSNLVSAEAAEQQRQIDASIAAAQSQGPYVNPIGGGGAPVAPVGGPVQGSFLGDRVAQPTVSPLTIEQELALAGYMSPGGLNPGGRPQPTYASDFGYPVMW